MFESVMSLQQDSLCATANILCPLIILLPPVVSYNFKPMAICLFGHTFLIVVLTHKNLPTLTLDDPISQP